MRLLRRPVFWVGLVLSVACVWLAFRGVPWGDFVDSLRQATWGWILVSVLAMVALIIARTARWQWLMTEHTAFSSCLWAQGIGFLFTNVLPVRLGDTARIVAVMDLERISLWRVTASMVLERILDLTISVLILLAVVPTALERLGIASGLWDRGWLLLLLGVGIVSAIALVFVVGLTRKRYPSLDSRLAFVRDELVQGVLPLLHWRRALGVVIWTAVTWATAILRHWTVIKALRPEGTLDQAVFLTGVLNLAMAIPSAPGYIGVYQYAGQQALVVCFGEMYTSVAALGIAVILHALMFILTTVLGLVSLWVMGRRQRAFSMAQVWRTEEGKRIAARDSS